jgi:hypothetical protein
VFLGIARILVFIVSLVVAVQGGAFALIGRAAVAASVPLTNFASFYCAPLSELRD